MALGDTWKRVADDELNATAEANAFEFHGVSLSLGQFNLYHFQPGYAVLTSTALHLCGLIDNFVASALTISEESGWDRIPVAADGICPADFAERAASVVVN